jgi:protein-tyrosine phosphatase
MKLFRVLFVCTGNICRSPTAEGVARALAERHGIEHRFKFDSAGTHDYHVGEAPDPRSVAAAARRGYDLSALRARRVSSFDFVAFDYMLAMDRTHLDILQRACPLAHRQKLGLFLDHSAHHEEDEVPDPYYGGPQGFDHVIDLVEDAALGLIKHLTQK